MKTIALLCLWMCSAVLAADPPLIPADLVQVKSGGQWQDGENEGFVRFCAFERGFDHIRHQVVIEWIHAPATPEDKLSVVSRIVIEDIPDVWSINEATFVVKDNKTAIHFEATNTYSPDKQAKFVIEILAVGKAKVTSTE